MSFRLAGLLKVVRLAAVALQAVVLPSMLLLPAMVWWVLLQVLADVLMLPAVVLSDLDLCRQPQWLLERVCASVF